MDDESFKRTMCDHMERQTLFLEQISEAMKALRWIFKTVTTIVTGILGYFTLSDYFGWKHK